MAVRLKPKNHPEQKPFFRAALQSDGTLELVIYEEIGPDYWSHDGGVTAKSIKQQIDLAPNFQRILVRINSPGGDAFEGIAIYNVLCAQKKPIEVCIDGLAASSASIIAMAGDTITMGPNTLMMIHNAWGWSMGYAEDMRKMADALDKISGAIAQTYVGRTSKTVEEIQALMAAETWMTAQECLAEGFCTAIVDESSGEVEQNALAMAKKFKSLARMKRVPENLKNDAPPAPVENADTECECDCQNCQDGDCSNCTNADCVDPNCVDCPMQTEAKALAHKAKLEFELLKRKAASR